MIHNDSKRSKKSTATYNGPKQSTITQNITENYLQLPATACNEGTTVANDPELLKK